MSGDGVALNSMAHPIGPKVKLPEPSAAGVKAVAALRSYLNEHREDLTAFAKRHPHRLAVRECPPGDDRR